MFHLRRLRCGHRRLSNHHHPTCNRDIIRFKRFEFLFCKLIRTCRFLLCHYVQKTAYSFLGVLSSASVASVASDLAVLVALFVSLEGTSTIGANVSFSTGFFLVSSSDQKSSSAIFSHWTLNRVIN